MGLDPFSPAMAALQIGSTIASGVVQYSSQVQAAKAQAKAQQMASIKEMERQQHAMSSERLRQSQEETTAAMEALKANREADEAMSTTAVAGEEAGVEGNAVGLAIADFAQKNAAYQAALSIQERMNESSRQMAFTGSGLQYQQNLMNINKPIQRPNFLGTFLGVGQQALGQYQAFQMQGLQRQNMARQNELHSARMRSANMQLAQSRAATATSLANLRLARESTRTTQAQRRLFEAQQVRPNVSNP